MYVSCGLIAIVAGEHMMLMKLNDETIEYGWTCVELIWFLNEDGKENANDADYVWYSVLA